MIISCKCYAGNLAFSVSSSYGQYSMSKLKVVNSEVMSSLPFSTKLINDFPGYYTFSFESYYLDSKHFMFGLRYTNETTASRLGTIDYSGSFRFDQTMNSGSIALMVYYPFRSYEVQVLLGLDLGIKFTGYSSEKEFTLGNTTKKITEMKDYTNFYSMPGIRIVYPISSFNLAFNFNYHLGIDKDTGATTVAKEWNGVRIGLSFAVIFDLSE